MKSKYVQLRPDGKGLTAEQAKAEVIHWTKVELAEHTLGRPPDRWNNLTNLDRAVEQESARRDLLEAQIDAGEPWPESQVRPA